MGPTGLERRVVQIHPTRRCNLRCLHCYSSSGPDVREELSPELLYGAIADAAAEGYTVVSVSGGEPLLYRPLAGLLRHARERELQTTVTTNGMLLDERCLGALRGITTLLAISLDGIPASHNRMRASERAFATMASRLDGVRRSGIPFGFIFTLTQFNLHELEWVTDFALQQGAALLHIHPLEEVGRAQALLAGACPAGIESSYAALEVARLQSIAGDRLHIHFDFAHRASLRAQPERAYAGDQIADPDASPLADLLSPLVIEPDGTVVPLQFGFPRAFALGNLKETSLHDLGVRWRRETHGRFRDLCHRAFRAALADTSPLLNWYETISRLAEASADQHSNPVPA
jgi:MoaA/NifB/PqqE/SkfB family radical SAM enzyme